MTRAGPEHGTVAGYNYWRCRCAECRAASTRDVARRYAERLAARVLVLGRWYAPRAYRHGSYNTYKNWGCRCSECTRANADYAWRRRHVRDEHTWRVQRHVNECEKGE